MSFEKSDKFPRIGVLMINYNQWELTKKCIESLLESQEITVIIGLVDNDSADSAPDWVANTPEIIFYQNQSNLGFIGGNIKAFELVVQHNVDYVILLNNDTEVKPDTLKLLAANFKRHPNSGLVTPAITYAEDRNKIWHAGGTFIPCKMGVKQLYDTIADLPEHETEIDQVSGCAMMMSPDLFKKIGYQDPDLFIYHEDVEQSLKAQKMGFTNYLVPAARVIHHVSITVGGVLSPFAVYFTHRNRYIFASRNLRGFHLLGFRLYYFVVTIAKTILYPARKSGHLVKWMWLALIHGVLNNPHKRPEKLFTRDK